MGIRASRHAQFNSDWSAFACSKQTHESHVLAVSEKCKLCDSNVFGRSLAESMEAPTRDH